MLENEEVESLRKALEQERLKTEELNRRLNQKAQESSNILRQTPSNKIDTSKLPNVKQQEVFLNFIEREEENITNRLQTSLRSLIQEKVDLESSIEQEQEYVINAMSRQVAKTLAEKLELKRKLELHNRSRSVSDAESMPEGSVTDSSFSSDSESGRETEERRRIKLLETELSFMQQQLRMAKRELRRYKQMQIVQQSDKGEDTDRSDFSIESSGSRSFGENMQDLVGAKSKDTPKKKD